MSRKLRPLEARLDAFFATTGKVGAWDGLRVLGRAADGQPVVGTTGHTLFVLGAADLGEAMARTQLDEGHTWESNAEAVGRKPIDLRQLQGALRAAETAVGRAGAQVSLATPPDTAVVEAWEATEPGKIDALEKLVAKERDALRAARRAKYLVATAESNLRRAQSALTEHRRILRTRDIGDAHAFVVDVGDGERAAFDLRLVRALLKLVGATSGTLGARGPLDPADLFAEGPGGKLFALVMPFRLDRV